MLMTYVEFCGTRNLSCSVIIGYITKNKKKLPASGRLNILIRINI